MTLVIQDRTDWHAPDPVQPVRADERPLEAGSAPGFYQQRSVSWSLSHPLGLEESVGFLRIVQSSWRNLWMWFSAKEIKVDWLIYRLIRHNWEQLWSLHGITSWSNSCKTSFAHYQLTTRSKSQVHQHTGLQYLNAMLFSFVKCWFMVLT